MVAGVAIFALYEVSTALSGREQRRAEASGWGPAAKVDVKVSERRGSRTWVALFSCYRNVRLVFLVTTLIQETINSGTLIIPGIVFYAVVLQRLVIPFAPICVRSRVMY